MNKTSWFLGVAGLLVGVILSVSFGALADGDPGTDDVPRTLPYQGVLELNGEPINAEGVDALHILFSLYDGQAAEEPTYTQSIVVEVYTGRFTATIGPVGIDANSEPIEIIEVITAADDLYLGMTLLGDPDDPEDDIDLNNRQRIHASPYSMWTTSATNFNVASTLNVGGTMTVGGSAVIGSGQPQADAAQLQVGNNVSDGNFDAFNDYQFLLHRAPSPAESAGLGLQDSGGTLFLNTASDFKIFEGGQQRLHLDNGTLRTDNIVSSGTISGNFQISVSAETNVARNGSGTVSRNLGSTARRICFLTKAGFKDIDSGSEQADCRVNTSNGQWRVQAVLTGTNDANAFCGARCMSW